AADDQYLVRLEPQLEQSGLQRGQHRKIAASRAPIRVDLAFVDFLGELSGGRRLRGGRGFDCGAHGFFLDSDFVDGDGEPAFAGQLFLHAVDEVVRHEWFAVVFADVPVRGRAGLGAQVTGELAAVIVFDDNHPLALRKNTRHHVGVERDNPLDVQLIRHDALFAGELFDGFANYSFGRAPADERDLGVFRPDELGRSD